MRSLKIDIFKIQKSDDFRLLNQENYRFSGPRKSIKDFRGFSEIKEEI
jgi:hypothetical protein